MERYRKWWIGGKGEETKKSDSLKMMCLGIIHDGGEFVSIFL